MEDAFMYRFAPISLLALLLAVGLIISQSNSSGRHAAQKEQPAAGPNQAICVIQPLSDSKVSGVVTFTKKGELIEVTGEIKGLTPGLHGFHVHEYGDLTDAKGMSTGGHFNPEGKKHGGPHA